MTDADEEERRLDVSSSNFEVCGRCLTPDIVDHLFFLLDFPCTCSRSEAKNGSGRGDLDSLANIDSSVSQTSGIEQIVGRVPASPLLAFSPSSENSISSPSDTGGEVEATDLILSDMKLAIGSPVHVGACSTASAIEANQNSFSRTQEAANSKC